MRHQLLLLIMALSLTLPGYSKYWLIAGKAGDETQHINGNYWLTVTNQMYESYFDCNYPGEYPGGSGCENLYQSGVWVGLVSSSGVKVSTGLYHSDEYEPTSSLFTYPGSWPAGLPIYGDLDVCINGADEDATENGPIPVSICRHTWSFTNPSLDDCVGFKYVIRNDSAESFSDVYVSHYTDFDIGGGLSYIDDVVGSDAGRNLAYMYDSDNSPPNYVGVTCGTGNWLSVGMRYWDILQGPDTDYEKINFQRNDGWVEVTDPWDYVLLYNFHFAGSDFEPGETIIVGFYQVAGEGLSELLANTDAATASYIEDEHGFTGIKSASLGQIKALYK